MSYNEEKGRIELLSEKMYALCQGEDYETAWQALERAKTACLRRAVVPSPIVFPGIASADGPQQCD